VRFASYDGLEIPGLLYRPHTASSRRPVPAVIWLRGSTGGQARVGYDPLIQYLVNHGYAYTPSTIGAAADTAGASALRTTGGTARPIWAMSVASKGMLIETGWIDPARIGVMGRATAAS
jgi:hypothetical protein